MEDADLDRGREILRAAEAVNSDDLFGASEDATQQTQPKGIDSKTGKPYEPVEIPVPKRSVWDGLLHRAENAPHGED